MPATNVIISDEYAVCVIIILALTMSKRNMSIPLTMFKKIASFLPKSISDNSESLAKGNPDLKERSQALKASVDRTIARVQTAQS